MRIDKIGEAHKMADRILGTCENPYIAAEILDLPDYPDWEDRLLDINVECCSGCGWWHESCMLTYNDETGKSFCDQCLEDEE